MQLLFADDGSEPPVNDLDDPFAVALVDEQILGLEVPVGNILGMRVHQRLQDFGCDFGRLRFCERIFDHQLSNKLFPVEQLSNYVEVVLDLVVLVELQDIGVVHAGQHIDLLPRAVYVVGSVPHYLQGPPQAQRLLNDFVYKPEGALSKFPDYDVVLLKSLASELEEELVADRRERLVPPKHSLRFFPATAFSYHIRY